jgi:hypothetical protein
VNARVFSAALKQDVITIFRPRLGKSCLNDSAPISLSAKVVMGYDVFEKSVPPPTPQQVRSGDEHASCGDPDASFRNKDGYAVARQYFRPNALGAIARLRARAHFGIVK